MANHLSDEEQLENLKKWWQRNGLSLALVLTLCAGGWFGWNYWQKQQQIKANEAAVLYMAMLDTLSQWEQNPDKDKADLIASHGESLKKLDEDGLYAQLASLSIARLAVTDGDYDAAAAELSWALEHAQDDAMKGLVRLRLASIEFARGNLNDALEQLNADHPAEYDGLYGELRGDILNAQGDNAGALAAYQAALENVSNAQARAVLELKINQAMPVAADNLAGEDDA